MRATCSICGVVELSTAAGPYSRCASCKSKGLLGHSPRTEYDVLGKEAAGSLVQGAIRLGEMPRAADHMCVDCGAQAQAYDHRDYNRPFDVVPVCHGCNLRRGPAIPLDGWLQKSLARKSCPYVLRKRAIQVLSRIGITTDFVETLPAKLTLEHWTAIAERHPELSRPKQKKEGAGNV